MMKKVFIGGLAGFAGIGAYVQYNKFQESRRRLNENTHVVIVGGGYAGTTVANALNGKGKYTLVDPNDSLHHNMAFPRAAVLPGFSDRTFVPYKPTFGDNVVQGRVKRIDTAANKIILDGENGDINFTKLVFATGSRGYFPGKCDDSVSTDELKKKFDDYAEMVPKAKKVVVIGGGAVGIEMAGEIAAFYPGNEVTVIHSGTKLVGPDLLPKAENQIAEKLNKMNIKVIRGDKVKNMNSIPLNTLEENIEIETESGAKLTANLVIPCIGLKVNSEAYANDLGEAVNERGQLKVDQNLRVVGHDNIFAVGDCNDVKCVKLATQAEHQAKYLADTILKIDEGKVLQPYTPDTLRMVIPLGDKGGIAQSGPAVLGDWAAKIIKGRDVFVKMVWGNMNQPIPEFPKKN